MNVHSTIHSRSGRGLLIAGSVAGVAILLAACGGAGTAKVPAASSAALATPTKAAAAAAVTKAVTETSAVTSTVKTEAAPAKTTAITETKAMTEAAGAAKTAAVTETKVMTEAAAAAKTAAMTETKATTETTTGTTTGAAAALVMLSDNATHGKILTDEKGMALYIFDKDSTDKSACTGDCLTKWPPLTVAAAADLKGGEGVTGTLATIKREDDGKLQVTINGMPLYHYYEDKQPGDAKGQAVGDVWWLVGADGSKISK